MVWSSSWTGQESTKVTLSKSANLSSERPQTTAAVPGACSRGCVLQATQQSPEGLGEEGALAANPESYSHSDLTPAGFQDPSFLSA